MAATRGIKFGMQLGLTRAHATTLAALTTPEKIQDFVTRMPTNFERNGISCRSVAQALRHNELQCIESAFVAACALWLGGQRPLLMDFQSGGDDDDHVIAVFQRGRYWGAISKSNHIWLRWRDPVYRTPRELAMSYFHEYVLGAQKTLRTYSRPFDLSRIDPARWVTAPEPCFDICDALDAIRHFPLVTAAQVRRLKPRDAMEQRAGKLLEYAAPTARSAARY